MNEFTKATFFILFLMSFSLSVLLIPNQVKALTILIPGETNFTIEPIVLEYLRVKDIRVTAAEGYLNVAWNAYYWSGRETDIGVKCYLNCEWPEANNYDIENNCALNQRCTYEGATGVGGCAIMSPAYIYQNTESNNVTCKFYDPSTPDIIYLPFPAVQFMPIAFDIRVAPQAKATVGEPFDLQVTIKNTGVIKSSYEVNVSSTYDFVHIENGFVSETESIEWNESTSVSPTVRIDLTQIATLFVKVKANSDPITCSVDSDCSYLEMCGLEAPVCDIDTKCARRCAIQISASKKGLPEFRVFDVLQIMFFATSVLFVSQKKLLNLKTN